MANKAIGLKLTDTSFKFTLHGEPTEVQEIVMIGFGLSSTEEEKLKDVFFDSEVSYNRDKVFQFNYQLGILSGRIKWAV